MIQHKSFWLSRFLVAVSMLSFRRPIQTLLMTLVLSVGCVLYAQQKLELKMDWTYLFYPDDPIVLKGNNARALFPLPGDIAVLVDKGTPEERQAFIDLLAERLAKEPQTFKHVFYRFDLKPLSSKALYYLDEKSLTQLADGLEAIDQGTPSDQPPKGASRTILLKLLGDLDQALITRGRASYVPIWEVLAEEQQGDAAGYIASLMKGQRYIYPTIGVGRVNVLLCKAGDWGETFANSGPLIVRLRSILHELQPTVKGLRIRLTGLPVMLFDEHQTASVDGTRSTVISTVLCVLMFIVGFGEVVRPLLGCLALAAGMTWTLGFTTLAVGHLNFITVTLASLLIGLGIDFSIHFIFRYDEELSKGISVHEAIERTAASNSVDTLVGAFATAAAFSSLIMAQFRGITDFGVIAAGGTMLTYASTAIVLPALLALFPGKGKGRAGSSPMVLGLEGTLLRNAGKVTVLGILILLSACIWVQKVGFSYNLLEVQSQEISTVQTELEMIRETKSSVLSAEAYDKGEAEARRKMKAYEALPTVARVGSILAMLPETNKTKQALIQRITRRLGQLELPEKVNLENAEDLLAVQRRVRELEKSMDTGSQDPEVAKAVAALKAEIKTMGAGPIQEGLSAFQEEVRDDLSQTLNVLKKQTAKPPTFADLPSELRLRYVNPDGYFRQTVQAKRDIWQRENLEPFLREVRSVDPEVMGHPVVQEKILGAFARTLSHTPVYTLAGILLVLAIHLRSVSAIIMALLPTVVGVLLMFGAMGYFGYSFNVVNFVGLPISVGLGAVYGVHALHRMRERNDETLLSSSTGPAILLSGLATLIGFASLMVAHHRGIWSLGFVTAVGVGVNTLGSLIFLPALHRVLRLRGRTPEEYAAQQQARLDQKMEKG